jgi:hypothetical protein
MAEKKPVYNAAGTHVYLYNPETGGLWECGPEAAEVFVEKLGWEYAEAPEEDTSELFPDVKPSPAKKAASKTSGD